MRKTFFLLSFVFSLILSGFSQKSNTPDTASLKAVEEMKAELVAKLNLPAKTAAKIVAVENDYYAKRSAIVAAQNLTPAEKEAKQGEAVRSRYAILMDIPLSGRQMEDAIEVVAQVRQKHKR